MIDQTNKRVNVEGFLKRKIIEETSQSDSQFIKGSKGSSSFTQPTTPKSTRKRVKVDSMNESFNIPNQLKSVFYSQENTNQLISLHSKASPKKFTSAQPSFMNYFGQSPNNNQFQFPNPSSFQYSEDDIFLVQGNNNAFNGPFGFKSREIPAANSNPNISLTLPSPNQSLFNVPPSTMESRGSFNEWNSFSSPSKSTNNLFSQGQHNGNGSFKFEEKINQTNTPPDQFRQQQTRQELDLFSPVHSHRYVSRVPNDTFSSLFSQFD